MHISILTASGKHNLGDELILREEFFILKKSFPDATFSIFTYDETSCLFSDQKAEFVSFFPNQVKKHPLKNIVHLIKNIITIAKSNFIVIGGGGLIYDRETQTNMLPIKQWKFRVLIAKLFRVPIIWWAVGINLTMESSKKHLKFLFGSKKTITTVRDTKSHELLNEWNINNFLLPDAVLGYIPEHHHPDYVMAEISGSPDTQKRVGISLRTGYTQDEKTFFKKMTQYIREKGYKIVFLSQSIHPEDTRANDALLVKEFAKEDDIITQTIQETLQAYQYLDFVIGMRLHSLILAADHTIPFLALSYETKTRELLRDLDYHFFLDSKTASFDRFMYQFDLLENGAQRVKFALQEKNDTIRRQGEDKIQALLEKIREYL